MFPVYLILLCHIINFFYISRHLMCLFVDIFIYLMCLFVDILIYLMCLFVDSIFIYLIYCLFLNFFIFSFIFFYFFINSFIHTFIYLFIIKLQHVSNVSDSLFSLFSNFIQIFCFPDTYR